jgi:glycosyltransferase involved in cell wall biosynthesis
MVDLSIVILSWNVCDLLRQCLKSVARDRPLSADHPLLATEIIVVDNASSDG